MHACENGQIFAILAARQQDVSWSFEVFCKGDRRKEFIRPYQEKDVQTDNLDSQMFIYRILSVICQQETVPLENRTFFALAEKKYFLLSI